MAFDTLFPLSHVFKIQCEFLHFRHSLQVLKSYMWPVAAIWVYSVGQSSVLGGIRLPTLHLIQHSRCVYVSHEPQWKEWWSIWLLRIPYCNAVPQLNFHLHGRAIVSRGSILHPGWWNETHPLQPPRWRTTGLPLFTSKGRGFGPQSLTTCPWAWTSSLAPTHGRRYLRIK